MTRGALPKTEAAYCFIGFVEELMDDEFRTVGLDDGSSALGGKDMRQISAQLQRMDGT